MLSLGASPANFIFAIALQEGELGHAAPTIVTPNDVNDGDHRADLSDYGGELGCLLLAALKGPAFCLARCDLADAACSMGMLSRTSESK